ncbi:hypothetical protein MKX03_024992 [Papaver bracteatum]|nr:hypothetical protein MKX03_024992 [Papaver bracteatum]
MCEITIENLRGTTMKIALWGSAANQVGSEPIDCDSVPRPVVFAVCSTFVKNYQGIPRDNFINYPNFLQIFCQPL